ncbi:hypothetical protein STXM2123_4688 [Streptomyces sp. F-3]|nr:hypothetical protein STXM2123_4688 [Streptomyces sp. F-3]
MRLSPVPAAPKAVRRGDYDGSRPGRTEEQQVTGPPDGSGTPQSPRFAAAVAVPGEIRSTCTVVPGGLRA